MAGLTTLLYILPLTFADNFLSHRTPDTFLQLIHPVWILLLTSSSHLLSLPTVEPRYLKFFALFTFSPCSFNSSPSSTPQPSNIRSCSGSLSGLFSPVHFSKLSSRQVFQHAVLITYINYLLEFCNLMLIRARQVQCLIRLNNFLFVVFTQQKISCGSITKKSSRQGCKIEVVFF